MKKAIAMLLTVVMVTASVFVPTETASAATLASSIRLEQTQGTVSVQNSSGKNISAASGSRLFSGYGIRTERASYAYLSLDSSKAAKLDASSKASVKKSNSKLELKAEKGSLMFNVRKPLGQNEHMQIRTSNMVAGVRGTAGWVVVIDQNTSIIYLLEGILEVTARDPVTGETRAVTITGGQGLLSTSDTSGKYLDGALRVKLPDMEGSRVIVTKETTEYLQLISFTYEEKDVPGFTAVEVASDQALQEKITQLTALDVSEITVDAEERLAAAEAKAEEASEALEQSLAAIKVEKIDQVFESQQAGSAGGGGGSVTQPQVKTYSYQVSSYREILSDVQLATTDAAGAPAMVNLSLTASIDSDSTGSTLRIPQTMTVNLADGNAGGTSLLTLQDTDTIQVAGTLNTGVDVYNLGTIRIADTGTLSVSSGSILQNSNQFLNSGTVNNYGTIFNGRNEELIDDSNNSNVLNNDESASGGGSGGQSSDIPEEDVPIADDPVLIEDPDIPLSGNPDTSLDIEDPEVPLADTSVSTDDEDVPLADAPVLIDETPVPLASSDTVTFALNRGAPITIDPETTNPENDTQSYATNLILANNSGAIVRIMAEDTSGESIDDASGSGGSGSGGSGEGKDATVPDVDISGSDKTDKETSDSGENASSSESGENATGSGEGGEGGEGVYVFPVTYVAGIGGSISNLRDRISVEGNTIIDSSNISGSTAEASSGYTFTGWYKDETLITTDNTLAADTITKNLNEENGTYKDTEFVARFEADNAYIVFEENGGSTVEDLTGKTDEPLSDSTMPESSRPGYFFDGWYDNADYSGNIVFHLPDSYPAGTTTYYAKWNIIDDFYIYNLDYDLAGGDIAGGISPHEAYSSIEKNSYTFTITKEIPYRLGHDFVGWKSSAGEIYSAGQKIDVAANTNEKLTAQWEIIEGFFRADLDYNLAGGSSEMIKSETADIPIDETSHTFTITSEVPIREGYIFAGWKGPSGQTVNAGEEFVVPVSIGAVITAQWIAIPDYYSYTLVYNLAGGTSNTITNGTASSTIEVTSHAFTVTEEVPTKEAYTFLGWKNTAGESVSAGEKIVIEANEIETLTAQWISQKTYFTNTGTINNYGSITLASGSVVNNTGTIRDYGTISSDGATWTGNEAIRP